MEQNTELSKTSGKRNNSKEMGDEGKKREGK